MKKMSALAMLAAVALAGCTLGPDYARPAVDTPPAWRIDYAKAAEVANTKWWEQFGDPVLNELIETALRENRDVRIAALIDSPRAFWSTYEQARARTDDDWAAFLETGPRTWLAFDGARPVGTVGLWRGEGQPEDESTLVGMWVASVVRGTDVAERLVRTALHAASDAGVRRVVLDVAHENVRAWAFYSRIGFRRAGEDNATTGDPVAN